MNNNEYAKVKNYSYEQYIFYLHEKYGIVAGNYFIDTFTPNNVIKRRNEELFIHHIKEDTVAGLSDIEIAKNNPFEYQTGDNLVYANLLEHILLHIMIGEQNNGLGYGGAELMIAQANDFYDGFDAEGESVLKGCENVLEELKERLRNGISAYDTLLQHNQTVFYELDNTLANSDRALVVIGTGLGKTTTALAYIRKYGMRGLVLGPNRIITNAWERNADVDVYTYQWFMNNYKSVDFSKYGVLICDEAHHCAAARWGEGIRYALDNGLVKVMGLTATPKEKKDKKNFETSSDFFKGNVCQGFTVLDGIERGIIHDFSYVGAIYDTSDIRAKYTDLKDEKLKGELDLALNDTPTMEEIFRKHMPVSRRKGIIFCSNISAIDEAETIMRKVYPDAEYRRMHSLMGAEAESAREWFENTDEGWLLAVNMISEGAHYKGVNTIVMFRRTASSLVFNQQLGRIIALARDEDPEAIVFDLVNNANNIAEGESFAGSLKKAYQQRKNNGGKCKSEQIIVEDYAEQISEILRKIAISKGHLFYNGKMIIIETQQVFENAQSLASFLGVSENTVTRGCRNSEIERQKVRGYHLSYLKDVERIKKLSCFIGKAPQLSNNQGRMIICTQTDKIYEQIKYASEENGGDPRNISASLRGGRELINGYAYAYVDDVERIAYLKKKYGNIIQQAGRKRRVRNKTTGEIFESVAAGNRAYKTTKVGSCCSGDRLTAGGCEWEYYN